MNKKVKHGSLEELISLNAREQRHVSDRPSDTRIVKYKGYRKWLVERMEEYDPAGKRSHAIASKYR